MLATTLIFMSVLESCTLPYVWNCRI